MKNKETQICLLLETNGSTKFFDTTTTDVMSLQNSSTFLKGRLGGVKRITRFFYISIPMAFTSLRIPNYILSTVQNLLFLLRKDFTFKFRYLE